MRTNLSSYLNRINALAAGENVGGRSLLIVSVFVSLSIVFISCRGKKSDSSEENLAPIDSSSVKILDSVNSNMPVLKQDSFVENMPVLKDTGRIKRK